MKHNIKRIVIILIGVALLIGLYWLGSIPYGVSSLFARSTPSCKGCNVVIISLDTTRASELPCYGYVRNTMPNLCRFADQNIRFENAYSQSSWTFPSATSMMTGLYPSSHRMYDNIIDTFHPSIQTLPKLYKQAGYQTVAIINSQETNIPFPAELTKQFDTIISTRGYYSDHEIQTWMDTFKQQSKRAKPLFLYIYTTHVGYYRNAGLGEINTFPLDPTFSPPPFVSQTAFTPSMQNDTVSLVHSLRDRATDSASKLRYSEYSDALSSPSTFLQTKKLFEKLSKAEQLFLHQEDIGRRLTIKNPEHLRYIQNLYDETLAILDRNLSPFLDLLHTPEYAKNTITIIYSDHGENLGDHGLWGHAIEPYSTLTHVPLIMRIPNMNSITYSGIAQVVDIFPTLLSITNIASSPKIQGKNLWPNPTETTSKPVNTYTIAQLNFGDDSSIKTSEWLLLTHFASNGKTSHRLYDLQNDPHEDIDVSGSHPDIVETLTSRYTEAISDAK